MSQQASPQQMNDFVREVDKFMQNYARLTSPQTRSDVYASGNPALISDYENAVSRGGALKTTIEATTGAWQAAKEAYRSTTDVTSMYIGDAIDWFRGLFGGGPDTENLQGLGALQLPAAVWVSGIIASALLLNRLMTNIFVTLEANRIQRDNPNTPRVTALAQAKTQVGAGLFEGLTAPMTIAAVAVIAWLLLGQKR